MGSNNMIDTNGLMQNRGISFANTVGIPQISTKPSIANNNYNYFILSDAIWRHTTWSTLVQAPSLYLSQCSLMISEVKWYSPDDNFTENVRDISYKNVLRHYNRHSPPYLTGTNDIKKCCKHFPPGKYCVTQWKLMPFWNILLGDQAHPCHRSYIRHQQNTHIVYFFIFTYH